SAALRRGAGRGWRGAGSDTPLDWPGDLGRSPSRPRSGAARLWRGGLGQDRSRRMNEPETIKRVLSYANTVAIVGLSSNVLRASHFVGYYLRLHGLRIEPVNPRETEVL